MKMCSVFIIGFVMFLSSSCSDKKNGIGYSRDLIGLSVKKVQLRAEGETFVLKTRGDAWWISGIDFQDKHHNLPEGVDTSADSFIIKDNDFEIERTDKNTLAIKLLENKSGKERRMVIFFQTGNYFDSVGIEQLGE